MSKTYTPQPDSTAARVIAFFQDNPDELLNPDDLEAKFGKGRNQFHSLLGAAVAAGVLKREANEDEELCYSLGAVGVKVAVAGAGAKPRAIDALWAGAEVVLKRKQRTNSDKFDYATLDLSSIEIKTGAPLPKSHKCSVFDWEPLLQKMKPGQHVELPLKIRSHLQASIKRLKKSNQAEFSIRKLNAETLGLWRVK